MAQNIENSNPSICDDSIRIKEIKVNFGQTVYLKCPNHLSETEMNGGQSAKWFYFKTPSNNNNKMMLNDHQTSGSLSSSTSSGHLVTSKRDKYIFSSDGGLVIMGTSESESGRYDCKIGGQVIIRYTISVDAKTCSVPTESDYRKLYSDWCNQLEKYKSLLNNWQKKQQLMQQSSSSSSPSSSSVT